MHFIRVRVHRNGGLYIRDSARVVTFLQFFLVAPQRKSAASKHERIADSDCRYHEPNLVFLRLMSARTLNFWSIFGDISTLKNVSLRRQLPIAVSFQFSIASIAKLLCNL